MNPDDFARYLHRIKAQCAYHAERPSRGNVITYRGFVDRQVERRELTAEQREAVLDEVARMVERYNEKTIQHRPHPDDHRKLLVYSRNPKGLAMTSKAEWRRAKNARWIETGAGWSNADGEAIDRHTLDAEVLRQIDERDTAQLKTLLDQERAARRAAKTITEAFRDWSDWIIEKIHAANMTEAAKGYQRAKPDSEHQSSTEKEPL